MANRDVGKGQSREKAVLERRWVVEFGGSGGGLHAGGLPYLAHFLQLQHANEAVRS